MKVVQNHFVQVYDNELRTANCQFIFFHILLPFFEIMEIYIEDCVIYVFYQRNYQT